MNDKIPPVPGSVVPPVPGSVVPPVPGSVVPPVPTSAPAPAVPPVCAPQQVIQRPVNPAPVPPVPDPRMAQPVPAPQPLQPGHSVAQQQPASQALPEVEYVISHVRGFFMNASGGRLHINANEFYFQPHAVNFNTITYRWTYDQIAGYSKGVMTYMKILLTDGRTETIQTYKKDAIINTLEQYRQAWFAARGIVAPPVKR